MKLLKNTSDTDLILTYQQTKDSAAFGELYTRYNQKVFLYCAKIVKDREKALDLTQDLFIKISIKLEGLQEPMTFVSWLFRIAHNDCIELLRKQKKNRMVSIEDCLNLGEETNNMDDLIQREKQLNQMQLALNQLPEEEKKMLLKKYMEEKSIIDLTEEYGLSQSAVKMRLSRSRDKAKSIFELSLIGA